MPPICLVLKFLMSETWESKPPSLSSNFDALKKGFRNYKNLEANLHEAKTFPVPQEVIDSWSNYYLFA